MSEEGREHSERVLLRLREDQLSLIDRAAEHVGLSRTGWMRMALLREARRELGEVASGG